MHDGRITPSPSWISYFKKLTVKLTAKDAAIPPNAILSNKPAFFVDFVDAMVAQTDAFPTTIIC